MDWKQIRQVLKVFFGVCLLLLSVLLLLLNAFFLSGGFDVSLLLLNVLTLLAGLLMTVFGIAALPTTR